jgi:hypothetical protein
MLIAMFAVATDPVFAMNQDRELEVSQHRKVQAGIPSSCKKSSRELLFGETDLIDEADAVINNCVNPSTPCIVNVPGLPSYSSFKTACSAAKGVFATYKASILCKIGGASPYINT